MKRSSWITVIVILTALAALAVSKLSHRTAPSDEDRIHALLVKGQTAIERKDLKAAMSCVSRDYQDANGLKYDALRIQAIQAFQQEGKYDVVLEDAAIALAGDKAEVTTTVTISLATQTTMSRILSSPLRIHLAREPARRWLVIAVKVWKITRIDGTSFEPAG